MSFSVDLIGPYPPPYGGVSVHIERLAQRLRAAGHEVYTHPQRELGESLLASARRFGQACRGEIQHFHTGDALDIAMIGLLSMRGRRCVLTVHGKALELQMRAASRVRRAVLPFLIRRIPAFVAVNGLIRRYLTSELRIAGDRVFEIPAFLPPDAEVVRATPLGEDVEAFFSSHDPVFSANAWTLEEHEGVPLYGADLLVELLQRARRCFPRAGVLFYLSSLPSEQNVALANLQARLEAEGLTHHYMIVRGSRPFGPALVRSSVLLRPTNTDGDAVSVREALWLGVPVIASDVVERPAGTVLFSNRDAESLWDATLHVCSDLPAARARLAGAARSDGFDAMLEVYRRILAA